jgi:hypothetical protein
MTLAYYGATALSVVLFLFYGAAVLFTKGMKDEFERFGLSNLRQLTGALEMLGALGLVAGQFVPALVVMSAGGLTVLIALGTSGAITWFEPVQPVLSLAGIAVLVWALRRRLVGCHHQARHNAVGELEQVCLAAAILTMDHIDGAEMEFGLGEHREIVKAEGVEHHESPGRSCGAGSNIAGMPAILSVTRPPLMVQFL